MSGISLILWQMMKRITMMMRILVMLASYMIKELDIVGDVSRSGFTFLQAYRLLG
jgi:hypothetical protein